MMTIIEAEIIERLRFQVAFARSALATLALMSGGGLLLTLGGNSAAALCYLWGVVAVCFAYLGGFLSQGIYYGVTVMEADAAAGRPVDAAVVRQLHARGARVEKASLGMALMSLLLFFLGACALIA